MKMFRHAAVLIAATLAGAAAQAQDSATYYYCYAYESDGNRVWVSSVRYGDSYDFTAYDNNYSRSVRDSYNVRYFSATGCRPYYESTDRSAIEDDRSQFVYNERNSYGKNVLFFN